MVLASQLHELKSGTTPLSHSAKRIFSEAFDGPLIEATQSSSSTEGSRHREEGLGNTSYLVLELFGGSAILTKTFCDKGTAAISVDWVRNGSKPIGPQVLIDLTTSTGREVVKKALRSGRIKYVHAGPPCGTASRAREKAMDRKLLQQGLVEPKPLRSNEHPEGLPGLTGINRTKVEAANQLYEFTAECCLYAHMNKIMWSVENPANSIMWLTKFFAPLLNTAGVFQTTFSNCAHGGLRPKLTKLVHNVPELRVLEATCPGNHYHKPWGATKTGNQWTFATAEEAAYPQLLCTRMCDIIISRINAQEQQANSERVATVNDDSQPPGVKGDRAPVELSGAAEVADTTQVEADRVTAGTQKAEAGKQARGKRSPVLLPEHKGVGTVEVTAEVYLQFDKAMPVHSDVCGVRGDSMPKGARFLRKHQKAEQGGSGVVYYLVFAMPWQTEEFVTEALKLQHPIDTLFDLDDSIYRSIHFSLVNGATAVINKRKRLLAHYEYMAKQMEEKEAEVHRAIHPDLQRVLESKKVMIFKKLCEDAGHDDPLLIKRLVSGFKVTGELDHVPEFEQLSENKIKTPSATVLELARTSKWAVDALLQTMRPSGDAEVDAQVYDSTIVEKDNGWLTGPFTREELDASLGPWVASRRFGLRQGKKLRNIDDLSEFLINATVGTKQKVPMGGVDKIMAIVRAISATSGERGEVWSPAINKRGSLHPSWTIAETREIVGRTLDLASAYKYLVRSLTDERFAIIAVFNPSSKQCEFFKSTSLPFGASGAVYGFNRIALAIRNILTRIFGLALSNFYDDYTQLEFEKLAESASETALGVFKLIGWGLAPDKIFAFRNEFDALGVRFDLKAVKKNLASVQNTERRKEAVGEEIAATIQKKFLRQPEAASLKGRLAFCESQHWARVGSMVAVRLSERAGGRGGAVAMTPELVEELTTLAAFIAHAVPRTVILRPTERCTVIFCDGAAEGAGRQDVMVAAVLFSPRIAKPVYWASAVPDEVVMEWSSSGSKQTIGQAEILPVPASKQLWGPLLIHARIIWMIDNESAREALLKSYSPVRASRMLLMFNAAEDARTPAANWYARVPTVANVADGPTRHDFTLLNRLGAVSVAAPNLSLRSISTEAAIATIRSV